MIRKTVEGMRERLLRLACAWFAALRERRTGFGGQASLADLIAFLSTSSKSTFAERESLLWDLVEEYQETNNEFPLFLLFVAYAPLLLRIRRRLISTRTPQDELDQIVITAFMMVLRRRSTKRCAMMPLHLRQRTERIVFAIVKRDSVPEVSGEMEDIPAEITNVEELALMSFRASFGGKEAELIRASLEGKKEQASDTQSEVEYQRLKKRRTRAHSALLEHENNEGPAQLFLIPRSWM